MSLEQRKTQLPGCWWILVSAASFVVGAGVVSVATLLTGVWHALKGNEEWVYVFRLALLSAGAGVVVGLVVGLGQWLVLRRRIEGAGRWIPASTLGFALGNGVGAILFWYVARSLPADFVMPGHLDIARDFWCWISGGAACGLILGSAQWLILRRAVRLAGWWIPANIVSWTAGAVLGEYTGGAVYSILRHGHSAGWAIVRSPWYESNALGFSDLVLGVRYWEGLVVVGIVVGVVTGLALARLLKRPVHSGR